MFCFFFSSRRRHTSSLRDWSSDVCSSDLERVVLETRVEEDAQERRIALDALEEAAGETREDGAVVARARGLLDLGDRARRLDLLVDDRLVERFLAREVAIERGLGETDCPRELAD